MNRVIIIGAGGFGREVLSLIQDIQKKRRDWKITGFLDSDENALRAYPVGLPIIGSPDDYTPRKDDRLICALGDPRLKLQICRSLQAKGGRFMTFIHPTARIGERSNLGVGAVLCAFTAVSTDVTLGDFVTLNSYTGIGHDAVIGAGSTLSSHCDVTGRVVLGEGVFLGSHAVITPGAKVGDYAKIGAGSVVLRRVKAGATVFGVPARQIYGF